MYLIIIDGLGISEENSELHRNAVETAKTPNIDQIMENNSYARLRCHGEYVGLPSKKAGNSEVGHLTIGSGRRVEQPYKKINRLFKQNKFEDRISSFLERKDEIHFVGLCSNGGVHSDIKHLKELCRIAIGNSIKPIVHFISDGRDVPPKSATKFVENLESLDVTISSVVGRHYAMDRDNNMDRTYKTIKTFIGESENDYNSAETAIQEAYESGLSDQRIEPSNIKGTSDIDSESSVFLFNFRDDRMRQLYKLIKESINGDVLCMTKYTNSSDSSFVIDREVIDMTLPEILESRGYNQYRVAESEKKPHVTWFFDGQKEIQLSNSHTKIIESPSVDSYNKTPGMKAREITDEAIEISDNSKFFCLVNYSNLDLVGHTGDFDATVEAVENVDSQVGRLVENIDSPFIVTSDHGNAEDMGSKDTPNTSHTLNKVPVIVGKVENSIDDGEIMDIAPTVLDLCGEKSVDEINGKSIID